MGGFGATIWQRTVIPSLIDIRSRFDRVMRNEGNTMVFETLNRLLEPPEEEDREPLGFRTK